MCLIFASQFYYASYHFVIRSSMKSIDIAIKISCCFIATKNSYRYTNLYPTFSLFKYTLIIARQLFHDKSISFVGEIRTKLFGRKLLTMADEKLVIYVIRITCGR